ncbi:MAG: hypothetical protein ACOC1F_03650 [Myxococcota bacterium]
MSARSGSVPPSPQQIVADVDTAGRRKAPVFCDACGARIEGEPAGRGLLIWFRGEERRTEEPALCESCAPAITAAGGMMWVGEEE